jgi:prophage maintenance system killer protein
MSKTDTQFDKGEIIIYQSSEKGIELQVRFEGETVWLNAHQIALLFGVNRPAIVKHINNIYNTSELERKSTCSILEQVAADGKIRKMNLYNLDMIISIGYRVNSKRATQFRIWATNVLRLYLVKGYAINQKRLLETKEKFKELQETISFLHKKSKHELLSGQGSEILNLLASYSKTLTLLEQYDKEKLALIKKKKGKFVLDYKKARFVIDEARKALIIKKEASDLFGLENSDRFKGILGCIYQTFDGNELYPCLEEKAAHVLYLVIKDHPFVDGNKRIASLLFVYFLQRNKYLYRTNGEQKINDNALVALALLIAESDAKDKDILIKIVTNLLND